MNFGAEMALELGLSNQVVEPGDLESTPVEPAGTPIGGTYSCTLGEMLKVLLS